jgi:hypothetical protein
MIQFNYYCHNSEIYETTAMQTRNTYIILLSERAVIRKKNEMIILSRISGKLVVRMGG